MSDSDCEMEMPMVAHAQPTADRPSAEPWGWQRAAGLLDTKGLLKPPEFPQSPEEHFQDWRYHFENVMSPLGLVDYMTAAVTMTAAP